MTTNTKPKILFIDDEPNILQGLERTLRPMRREWNMSFVFDGKEALNLADRESYDVLVCDLCLPGVNGIDILERFLNTRPDTIRVVLSGKTDRETFWQAIGLAHTYVGKPCSTQVLGTVISRALDVRRYLPHPTLRRVASQTQFIPFYQENLRTLEEEAEAETPNMERIATAVVLDIGMSAKVLQIANSAYTGSSEIITNPETAVLSLGIEGVKALIRAYKAAPQSNRNDLPLDLYDSIRHRCLYAAFIARRIAEENNENRGCQYKSFLAGLLHGVGEILLLAHDPNEYRRALNKSLSEKMTLWKAERGVFGCTHAEVSSFLLNLWGLPIEVIDALAFHHERQESEPKDFDLTETVRVADSLAGQLATSKSDRMFNNLDIKNLRRAGLSHMSPVWRNVNISILSILDAST